MKLDQYFQEPFKINKQRQEIIRDSRLEKQKRMMMSDTEEVKQRLHALMKKR